MTLAELADLHAQREYFRTTSPTALAAAKRLADPQRELFAQH